MQDSSHHDFDEARAVLRRGNVMIPLTEWMDGETFESHYQVFKVLESVKPKSVILGAETRHNGEWSNSKEDKEEE